MISHDEIITALKTLKMVCVEQKAGCPNCPLRTKEDPNECVLQRRNPPWNWKIKGCEIWRAFEE